MIFLVSNCLIDDNFIIIPFSLLRPPADDLRVEHFVLEAAWETLSAFQCKR